MSGSVERFRKRRAALSDASLFAQHSVRPAPRMGAESGSTGGLPVIVLPDDEGHALVAVDADALLAEIHGRLDSEKIGALIDACQKECLQAVIRPFGLARVLFQNKDGGNVTTTHNFTKGVVATEEDREKYKEWQNRKKLSRQERRKAYNNASKATRDENKKPGSPDIVSGYTGKTLSKDKNAHYEHITSVREIDSDPGRNLRMSLGERVALANSDKNTTYAEAKINQDKSDKDLLKYYNSLSDEQREQLGISYDLVKREYKKSKRYIAIKDAQSWIRKDGKEICTTGVNEGGRMALQQAIGVLMEEFVRAAFAEVRDVWHNGFRGKVDDAFLDVLKLRLMRIADRVQAKWKDAAVAFRDGFISGFLSNLVTVAINAFVTTSARWVRITREGFMSLYRAMKTLAFPPEGMSLAEAADAASKLLVAGVVTGGGILLEEVIEKALAGVLGPLAPYVSAIAVGVATGLCTVFAVHMLDRLDLFGVNARTRHAQVVAKLDETISLSYDRALEAASAFDPPSLLHLA